MKKLSDGLSRLLEILIAVLLAVMVVLVFGNVVLRYAFNSGITVSEELSRWLFVWMTFLGSIVALRDHGHLGTDILTSRLPLAGKRACAVVACLLMLYITWLLLSGSWTQMQINREIVAPVSGASVAIFYASGLVFALASAWLLLRQLWRALSGTADEAELALSQESEELAQVQALHFDQSKTFKNP